MKYLLVPLLLCSCLTSSYAAENSDSIIAAPTDWDRLSQRMQLLSKIAYIPSLLPVIMKNRDTIELTPSQVAAFRAWRKENYQKMVDSMNGIIERRLVLASRAMDPGTSGEEIQSLQEEIFALQRDVLRLRLGCRQLVVETFTEEQWTNFHFVLEEYPNLAGLLK